MKRSSGASLLLGLACVAVMVLVVPGAAEGAGVVFVKNNRMGVGVENPLQTLHVKSSPPVTALVGVGGGGPTRVLTMQSTSGFPFMRFDSSPGLNDWDFTGGNLFAINENSDPQVEFKISGAGNLTILGTLTENSSRTAKTDIVAVDAGAVLDSVLGLEISEWAYKEEDRAGRRHIGPMAEDFYSAFGLGADGSGISTLDTAGVALAAIQGLHGELQQKSQRIEQLERELREIRQLLDELRQR